MDIVKDRRTHPEYGHPYRSFWHVVQLVRDPAAWIAGGLFFVWIGRTVESVWSGAAILAVALAVFKAGIFEPLYRSSLYRDWCWFMDEYRFRFAFGIESLDEWFGFDYNPIKRSREELEQIWRDIRNKVRV